MADKHRKKNFLGNETETGVVRILVIFQERVIFSYIIQEVLARAFH